MRVSACGDGRESRTPAAAARGARVRRRCPRSLRCCRSSATPRRRGGARCPGRARGDQSRLAVGDRAERLAHDHGSARAAPADPAVERAAAGDERGVAHARGARRLAPDDGRESEGLGAAGEVGGEIEQVGAHVLQYAPAGERRKLVSGGHFGASTRRSPCTASRTSPVPCPTAVAISSAMYSGMPPSFPPTACERLPRIVALRACRRTCPSARWRSPPAPRAWSRPSPS